MRAVAAAGAALVAVVALTAALMAMAPFDAAAQVGGTEDASSGGTAADHEPLPRPGGAVAGVLAELVDEGVITSAQAEMIAERLQERAEELRTQALQRLRTRRIAGKLFGDVRSVIVAVTGLTTEEFAEAWRSGSSIGETATEAGVTRNDLAGALVVAAEEKIDAWLEDDRISDEQAERLSDGVSDHAGAVVDRLWDRSRSDALAPHAGTPDGARDG